MDRSKTASYVFLSFAAIAIVTGVTWAIRLRWATDDAFISFRYAQNLFRGLGPVYNSGERVEGYTNFLWTVIAALGMKCSLDPVALSIWLGIAFYAGTLGLLAYASWKMQQGMGHLLIPAAALAVCVHFDVNVFATSGLESSMYTFFVTGLYVLLALNRSNFALVVAGAVSALAMLTRPDGIVFVAAVCAFMLIETPNASLFKRAAFFFAPFLLLYAPYWIWRYSYYGFVFPNTYYAKSADMPYYSQGLEYLRLYMQSYPVLYFLPTLLILAAVTFRGMIPEWFRGGADGARLRETPVRAVVLGLLFVVLQTVYVVRVGGDFMFARFFICIMPAAYFTMESLIVMSTGGMGTILIAAAIVAGTYMRHDVFQGGFTNGYIANERLFYPFTSLKYEREFGEELHAALSGLPVRAAFGGTLARAIFYMDPPYAIEAATGLTDTALAHRKIMERGRPGHEKQAPIEYLLNKRVQFYFDIETAYDSTSYRSLMMYQHPVRLLYYDSAVMTPLLKNPQIRFTDFPKYLDAYIAGMDTLPREKVREDFEGFKEFYFDEGGDSSRAREIANHLARNSDSVLRQARWRDHTRSAVRGLHPLDGIARVSEEVPWVRSQALRRVSPPHPRAPRRAASPKA